MSLVLGTTKITGVYKGNANFTPVETTFSTAGVHSYTVPTGATRVDVVVLGGGGGSDVGGSGGNGWGGAAGSWGSKTLIVGVDVAAGAAISVTVGAGGIAGTSGIGGSKGKAGGNSLVSQFNLVGLGGAGGVQTDAKGASPGTFTFKGRTYVGGASVDITSTNGVNGLAPGGGASGGKGTALGSNLAATGANGQVWFYAYASNLVDAVYLGDVRVWPDITPLTQQYNTAGAHTYTIPAGANHLDVIVLGAGGGANSGGGGNTNGGGAGAGSWQATTLNLPQSYTTLNVTVGAGGIGTTSPGTGTNGGASSVTATGWAGISSSGGQGGQFQGVTLDGSGAGSFTYNGVTYVGGAPTGTLNNTADCSKVGNAPGGGGSGGRGAVTNVGVGPGGNGAAGSVWIHAY